MSTLHFSVVSSTCVVSYDLNLVEQIFLNRGEIIIELKHNILNVQC